MSEPWVGAMKAVLVEKRQALLNVMCDVDTNAGGD